MRAPLAVALVLATWNPAGVSYAQWALVDTGAFNAGKALVGVINALGSRRPVQAGELSEALLKRLLDAHLLSETLEGYVWYACVHPKDPFEALDMGSGDWYI